MSREKGLADIRERKQLSSNRMHITMLGLAGMLWSCRFGGRKLKEFLGDFLFC